MKFSSVLAVCCLNLCFVSLAYGATVTIHGAVHCVSSPDGARPCEVPATLNKDIVSGISINSEDDFYRDVNISFHPGAFAEVPTCTLTPNHSAPPDCTVLNASIRGIQVRCGRWFSIICVGETP